MSAETPSAADQVTQLLTVVASLDPTLHWYLTGCTHGPVTLDSDAENDLDVVCGDVPGLFDVWREYGDDPYREDLTAAEAAALLSEPLAPEPDPELDDVERIFMLSAESLGEAPFSADGKLRIGEGPDAVEITGWHTDRPIQVWVRRWSNDLTVAEVILPRHDGLAQEELDRQNAEAEIYPLGPKEYWRGEIVGKWTTGDEDGGRRLMTEEDFDDYWAEGNPGEPLTPAQEAKWDRDVRAVWAAWEALPDGCASPVKTIARDLSLPTFTVALIVFPPPRFGVWADSQEPDL